MSAKRWGAANRLRPFADLVAEAAAADVSGWSFDWLDGRATEERPPWGYSRIVASRLGTVASALDIDTGGGEFIAEMPHFPPRMAVTEGWPPNAARARELLSPRGVEVMYVEPGAPLPFPEASFELVTSRHPVKPQWDEIARVLTDEGSYLAQHVGPGSAQELIERFLGPQPTGDSPRDPARESAAAQAAGLSIVDIQTARCRMEFFDIGAIVYILRKCIWWVPDFTVERYRTTLEQLDSEIREQGAFAAHSTRHLIEARKGRWSGEQMTIGTGPALARGQRWR